jgi:hypothetical protein
MEILLFLLVALVYPSGSKVSSDQLEFLVEDGPLEVATSIRAERLSLEYALNLDEETRATTYAKIKALTDEWSTLEIFKNADLKGEFFEKLDEGKEDFAISGSNLKHAATFLSTEKLENKSTCVFHAPVLSKSAFISVPDMFGTEFNRIKTFTVESFQTKPEHYTAMYSFIDSFNSIAYSWRDITEQQISEMDILRSGNFPESLKGHIESLVCLQSVKNEYVKVKTCDSGSNNFICEAEFRFPNKSDVYTEMKVLNYNGVQLYGTNEAFRYVKDFQTQKIVLLNCSQFEYINERIPLCTRVEGKDQCLSGILHKEIDKVLAECQFEFHEPIISERIFDESILVQKNTAQVSENGRLIFRNPPIQIYSNYEVIVNNANEELVYRPSVTFEKQQVLTTRLSSKQIQAMYDKANWDHFLKNFHWSDYAEYSALGLQIIFIPLAICGACLGCKNHGKSKEEKRAKKDYVQDLKRRHEENETLIKMPMSRIIAIPQKSRTDQKAKQIAGLKATYL